MSETTNMAIMLVVVPNHFPKYCIVFPRRSGIETKVCFLPAATFILGSPSIFLVNFIVCFGANFGAVVEPIHLVGGSSVVYHLLRSFQA